MVSKLEIAKSIKGVGYAIVPKVLAPAEITRLILLLEKSDDQASNRRRGSVYAVRNLLDVVPDLRRLAASPEITTLVEPILGPQAFPIRGILFDKPHAANWKVPWHQDLSIAVKEKKEVQGFGPWSIKEGVLHVQPTVSILQNMLAVRIHLDDCAGSNGPLRVIPGSHRLGRLSTAQISQISERPSVTCEIPAGGVLLMRPLLLHASSPAKSPHHRRVLHIEFASRGLPGGLEWTSPHT